MSTLTDQKNTKRESLREEVWKSIQSFQKRFPDLYDVTIFKEIDSILSKVDSYVSMRSKDHLAKIIRSLHVVRQKVSQDASFSMGHRHIHISIFPAILSFPFSTKKVVGISLGMNFLNHNERFGYKHILSAVDKWVLEYRVLRSSFVAYKETDQMSSFYFELESKNPTELNLAPLRKAISLFKSELKNRIEYLVPQLFMTRNEEEIMKTVFALSQEIVQVDDIPQSSISLQYHNQFALCFNAVVLRVLKEGVSQIDDISYSSAKCTIEVERNQIVKYIDQKIPVEMFLISIKFHDLTSFERSNFSVNLLDARKKVVEILYSIFKELRDYNGGLLLKQNQALQALTTYFPEFFRQNSDALESFFYSISPIEYQATLPINVMVNWFRLFIDHFSDEIPSKTELVHSSIENWDQLLIISKDKAIFKVIKKKEKKCSRIVFKLHFYFFLWRSQSLFRFSHS